MSIITFIAIGILVGIGASKLDVAKRLAALTRDRTEALRIAKTKSLTVKMLRAQVVRLGQMLREMKESQAEKQIRESEWPKVTE